MAPSRKTADSPGASAGVDCIIPPDQAVLGAFVDRVFEEGDAHRRDLPWRFIDDSYAVLVSEVMLQQTQVSRVQGRWERWCERFPTPDALAAADVSEVLGEWQGLGYNRRALALKSACEVCSSRYGGAVPDSYDELLALPGIGPATAAGIEAFARNRPAIYLETNVRTVLIHEFFPSAARVPDRELVPILRACLGIIGVLEPSPAPRAAAAERCPRTWYYALLDYGAHLKATIPNPSRRSASYARQSPFEGSHRQKRSELLRFVLASEGCTTEEAVAFLDDFEARRGRGPLDPAMVSAILNDLSLEGFFRREGELWVS